MDLHLQQVSKAYADRTVFNDLSLRLDGIHALVLIGPSGGGKSTLLRMLAGLETPNAGTIDVNGKPVPFSDPEALRRYRAHMGFVFQAHNLFPHLTALDNVALPLEKVHGLPYEAARLRATEWLERFQLASHARQRPAELSGGQQQRVAIARAVATGARLLFFDEPTSALDPEMTAEVLDVIAELRSQGHDLVVATHQMGFARRVADTLAFVGAGGVPALGTVASMLDAPESPLVRRFLERVLAY